MKFLILISLFFVSIFAKIVVAVSIPPQEYILENIAGNLVEPIVIVKPGNSPHTYEPKPSQMVSLSKAKLYLAIGVEFEKVWLKKFKNQNPNLKIVHCDNNISKIPMLNGHERGELDPHIWLNPKNIKQIAICTENALSSVDSNNSKIYQANLKKFLVKIDKLNNKVKEILSKAKVKKFLIFHPSWGYFAKEYGLGQIAVEIEGKEPSPKELINIIKLAKKSGVKVIFVQPEFSQKEASLIANEIGIKVVKVSPLSRDLVQNILNFAKEVAGESIEK